MTTETENKPASSEQAADLAALTAAAQGDAPAAAPGAQPEQQGPQPPSAASVALATMLVGMLKPIACYLAPALKKAPDELWAPVPEGMAAVLDHYDLGESELLRNPWARLGLSCAPLIAYAAMNAEPEKPAGKPQALAAPAAPPAAGGGAVTFGDPVPAGGAA